nr:unnamed protein product [Digitaria exilis]
MNWSTELALTESESLNPLSGSDSRTTSSALEAGGRSKESRRRPRRETARRGTEETEPPLPSLAVSRDGPRFWYLSDLSPVQTNRSWNFYLCDTRIQSSEETAEFLRAREIMVAPDVKAETMKLMDRRGALEAEMDAIIARLTAPGGPGITGGLVDAEGFPRSDIDIPNVLAQRQRLAGMLILDFR